MGSDVHGVVGPHRGISRAVRKREGSGTAWEGRPERVKAPYAKPERLHGCGA